MIDGIESVAYSKGYNIIMTQTHEPYELELSNVNHLTIRAIDDLVISLSNETRDINHIKKLQEMGLPIVFFDRVSNDIETHKVIAHNFRGGYEATMHLIKSGYRKIAHITSSVNVSTTAERLNGYLTAFADSGLEVSTDYIKYCPRGGKNITEVDSVLNDLFNMAEPPDAIFTASDRITTTTLGLLHKLKVWIPEEIALLGYINTQLAEVLSPSLIQVCQPGFDIGKKAAEMLINFIESKRR